MYQKDFYIKGYQFAYMFDLRQWTFGIYFHPDWGIELGCFGLAWIRY